VPDQKRARWKHGRFSEEAREEMAHFRDLLRECKELEELALSRVKGSAVTPPPSIAIGTDVLTLGMAEETVTG